MRRIVRTSNGWGLQRDDGVESLTHSLGEMLRGAPIEPSGQELPATLLAPVDEQEVWAAGVTYERSLSARSEESREPDVYERVYTADRPELFFKSLPHRVVGAGGTGCIRNDSGWDVPEPEVALVIAADGSVFGYTLGDDLSSRSIEGSNPLYLPQAKVYEGACVLGPCIVPAADAEPPFDLTLTITRDGASVFEGSTSTSRMKRTFRDLAAWLLRGLRFRSGVVLLTGTGIVPPDDFTLRDGDHVAIGSPQLGRLEHGVRVLDHRPAAG